MIKKSEKKKYIIAFALIVLAQLCLITFRFATEKKGYHIDEIWQYSLSNSADGYGVVKKSTRSDDFRNLNMWIQGEVLNDLITVQSNEILDFESIWDNARMDTKGPLGNVPLHIVSSFTPNVFSRYQMYILNVICFIVVQIYLFLLTYLYGRDIKKALATIVYFGFTAAALNTVVFLRMYAIEAMFCVMFTYYSVKIFIQIRTSIENDTILSTKEKIKMFFPCLFLNFLGGMTDYLYLVYAFVITAFISLYVLIKKRFKELVLYTTSSLVGVGLIFLAFPEVIEHIQDLANGNKVWGNPVSLEFSMRIFFAYIKVVMAGIPSTIYRTMTSFYVLWGCIFLFIVALIVRVLFRKEWKRLNINKRILGFFKTLNKYLSNIYIDIAIVVGCVVMMVYVAHNVNLLDMGHYVDRYLMPVFPIFAFFFARVIYAIIRIVLREKKDTLAIVISTFLLLIAAMSSQFIGVGAYFFDLLSDDRVDITRVSTNANMIFLCNYVGDPVVVTESCRFANQVWFSEVDSYYSFCPENVTSDEHPVYLMLNTNSLEEYNSEEDVEFNSETKNDSKQKNSESEILSYYKEVFDREPEYVGMSTFWTGDAVVYRLK